MADLEIQKALQDDVGELQRIAKQTFFETFASFNSEQDMQKYLDLNFNIDKLKSEVANTHSDFYLAKMNGRVVGYLKINFGNAQTEIKDPNAIEVERIYILNEFKGRGIGKSLFDTALTVAIKAQKDYLWLGVWEENLRAINFYEKIGFRKFDQHIFKLGDDEQTDIMMKLEIQHGERA